MLFQFINALGEQKITLSPLPIERIFTTLDKGHNRSLSKDNAPGHVLKTQLIRIVNSQKIIQNLATTAFRSADITFEKRARQPFRNWPLH